MTSSVLDHLLHELDYESDTDIKELIFLYENTRKVINAERGYQTEISNQFSNHNLSTVTDERKSEVISNHYFQEATQPTAGTSYNVEIKFEEDALTKSKKYGLENPTAGSCMICTETKNNLRNIHENDFSDGNDENYSKMILSLFHIQVVDQSEAGEICETCILRLKDATLFHKQVVNAAERVIEHKKNLIKDEIEQTNFEFNLNSPYNDDDNGDADDTSDHLGTNNKREEWISWIDKYPVNPPNSIIIPRLERFDRICPVCQEEFNNRKEIVKHYNLHSPKYLCEVCGKVFALRVTYCAHMDSHENNRFACPQCHKTYSLRASLVQHIKISHDNKKLLSCPECKERFSRTYNRHEHLYEVHGVWYNQHFCTVCQKKCFTAYRLDLHMRRVHLKEKTSHCPECDKVFFNEHHLKGHMVIHTGIRNFHCDICSKAFKTRKHLIGHLNIHYDIRKFKCTICEKAFVQKTSLNVHMNSHKKEIALGKIVKYYA